MSESERHEARRRSHPPGMAPGDGEVAASPPPGRAADVEPPRAEPGPDASVSAPSGRPSDEGPESAAEASREEAALAVEDELGRLRRDLAERNDQLLRLAADFENFRRRKNQELADRSRYAAEEATRALLPVLDNLRRAVDHLPGEAGAQLADNGQGQLHEGLRMVVSLFEQALGQIGVEPVETVGAAFDPSIHEAIGAEESDAVERDTVIAEMQPGYRLHDRLIRPALVRIAHPRPGRGA